MKDCGELFGGTDDRIKHVRLVIFSGPKADRYIDRRRFCSLLFLCV